MLNYLTINLINKNEKIKKGKVKGKMRLKK